jgi:tetratricopeptide (TPR) repeat protein
MHTSSRKSRLRRAAKSSSGRNGRRSVRGRTNSSPRVRNRRNASPSRNGSRSATQTIIAQPDPRTKAAVKLFAEATRHFYREDFSRAKEVFEKLANGAPSEIAARARVRIRLCDRRLSRSGPAPRTPTDYYNLGVAEINARDLERAIEHLTKADKAAPRRDEIQYALAAARSLQGNVEAALEHLKTAITLRPENRFLAQHDGDFEPLRSDPRFRSLLRSGVSSSPQYTL